jgi:hypothetical protein
MEKLGLIDRLKEILSHEDLLPFNKEAHELKAKFAHLLMDKESVSEEANEELVEESVHDVSEEAQDAEIVEV